jgi:hypothetical protein
MKKSSKKIVSFLYMVYIVIDKRMKKYILSSLSKDLAEVKILTMKINHK